MDFKSIIAKDIVIDGVDDSEIIAMLAPTPDSKSGDICLPCFKFAKTMRKAPQMIANELKIKLDAAGNKLIAKTEVVGGYLNIFYDREYTVKLTLAELKANDMTAATPHKSNGKTVTIDYSSINIAKPFHIGHLLTTVIGGSLYKIYKYLGYNAVGINHLGDWGTQFGKMIVAYLKWGDDGEIEKRGVRALVELYVRFHTEAEANPALDDEARAWFKKIEDGDEQATALFNKFKDITIKEVKTVYDTLGIEFDSYAGESFYNDKMQPIIDELEQKGLLTTSEGAKVVNLDEYDMPPCLILKSDGATLYATRDLAAAQYRKDHYDFYKNLYVVAYQQNLHFKQIFKVMELMDKPWASDCVHVPFGMVSLEGQGSLSTRKGNVVYLEDVLSTAVNKALSVIESKNPDLDGKEEIAKKVGVGAVVFGALSQGRIKDLVFSYDKALSFEGETAPYIQYTHARCRSVISRVGECTGSLDESVLTDEASYALVKLLANFDATVADAAEKYEPSVISRYLIDLSKAYNKFYLECRILGETPSVMASRLYLTECVANTLRDGLSLILINAPDKM